MSGGIFFLHFDGFYTDQFKESNKQNKEDENMVQK